MAEILGTALAVILGIVLWFFWWFAFGHALPRP